MTACPLRSASSAALRLTAIALLGLASLLTAGCRSYDPKVFDERLRGAVFDEYWEEIDDHYAYRDQLELDWDALGKRYRPRALAAQTRSEFIHVLARMIGEIGDPHNSLDVPLTQWRADGLEWTSLVLTLAVLEDRLFVLKWPKGTEPERPESAPDPMLAELLAIDGHRPCVAMISLLLSGDPGSRVVLQLQWPDGVPFEHVVSRPELPQRQESSVEERVEVPKPRKREPLALEEVIVWRQQDDLGYLRIKSFDPDDFQGSSLRDFVARLDQAFEELRETRGLIVDLQNNGGGKVYLACALGSRLVRERTVFGRIHFEFLGALPLKRRITFRPRKPTYDGKVVVLVNHFTGSASEHIARCLQAVDRATVIGEPTIGAEAAVEETEGPDGTTLTYGRHPVLTASGESMQGTGVIPDVNVPLRIADVQRLGYSDAFAAVVRERHSHAVRVLEGQKDHYEFPLAEHQLAILTTLLSVE